MQVLDGGGKPENRKTCRSKYGLEIKCTYNRWDWESNLRLIGEKQGNYRCANSLPRIENYSRFSTQIILDLVPKSHDSGQNLPRKQTTPAIDGHDGFNHGVK